MHIKNKKQLLLISDAAARSRRSVVLDIIEHALLDLAPERLLKGALPPRSELRSFKKIGIFAIGKAARGMARAAIVEIKRRPDFVLYAGEGHPLPTATSVENTEKMCRAAQQLGKDDCAIVLISGGGSAMFEKPSAGFSLGTIVSVTKKLFRGGATIQEMNAVRKHFSAVKGGRFAELLWPARVFAYVISDVIGNDLSTIASGPLSPDPTTCDQAMRVMKKYGVKGNFSSFIHETPKGKEPYFKTISISIVADHATSAGSALKRAKKLGIQAKIVTSSLDGEARKGARDFVRSRLPYPLTIATGETTVTCRGKGKGGRNQEFVLAGLPFLTDSQTLTSIGTDGIDGICPEAIAGAIGDSVLLQVARRKKLSIEAFLNNNDSYEFFKKAGGLIKTGATGTNVGDLILLLDDARPNR